MRSASGKLGAVNVHTSPGLGNAMGMLYDAMHSGAPMLLTAGQHDQAMNLTEPILWSDLPPVARPYVKWSHEITRLEDLPRACAGREDGLRPSVRSRLHLASRGRAERRA
jgi:benzoylformate decarboxylase